MKSFVELIDQWPTLAKLAEETGQKYETAQKWRQRGNIPAEHWLTVIEAAARRGVLISAHDLAKIAREKRAA